MSTIVELKAKLRRYGLPVSGVKAVLIRRLAEASAVKQTKRVRRAVITKNHLALRLGTPRERREAVFHQLHEETEAALRASGYEKHLKRDPALRRGARRRLRRRQIASQLYNEVKSRLTQDLRFLDLDEVVPHPIRLSVDKLWVDLLAQAKEEFEVDGAVRTFSPWYVERAEDDIEDCTMTDERTARLIQSFPEGKFLCKTKFIRLREREDVSSSGPLWASWTR
jgi:hypothetical protein